MTFVEWLDEIVETSSRRDHINECVAYYMTGNMSDSFAEAQVYELLYSAYQAGRKDGYKDGGLK